MKVFKLQMYSSFNEDELCQDPQYSDIWIDILEVIGFTIPLLEDRSACTETVNIFIKGGDKITVKRDEDLIYFLTDKFVAEQWN